MHQYALWLYFHNLHSGKLSSFSNIHVSPSSYYIIRTIGWWDNMKNILEQSCLYYDKCMGIKIILIKHVHCSCVNIVQSKSIYIVTDISHPIFWNINSVLGSHFETEYMLYFKLKHIWLACFNIKLYFFISLWSCICWD